MVNHSPSWLCAVLCVLENSQTYTAAHASLSEATRTRSMADTRCSQHQPLKSALCTICRPLAALALSSLSEDVCGASSAGASCATLLPWMLANRNGDVRSQVRIANRGVLSTACAAGCFLLVGLFGRAVS